MKYNFFKRFSILWITSITNKNQHIIPHQLGKAILSGAIWNIGAVVFTRGFSYIVLVILARLLFPEVFGIVSMAVVFTGLIGAVGDLGLAAALIQRHHEKLETIHYHTAFWASVVFNGFVFLIFATIISHFAAWFYQEPILYSLIIALSAQAWLSVLGVIPKVILTRKLRFKALVLIEGVSNFIGGVTAIVLAIYGIGVWSLIAQNMLSIIISIPLLWLTTSWRPQLNFSMSAFKDIFGYGIFDGLHRSTIYFTNNIDYLLVGKLLGAQLLGIYSIAFLLTDTVRQQIMAVLNKIMFPVYGKLQDNLSEIKKYYLLVIRYNTLLVTPVMLVFIFYADLLISLLFGQDWTNAAFPLRAMALAAIIHAIGGTTDSVLRGIGKVNLLFKIYLVKTVFITFPAFILGIYFFGLNGASCAVVIHKLAGRIIYQHFMKKFLLVREYDIVTAIFPTLCGTIASVIAFFSIDYLFIPSGDWLYLILVTGMNIAAFSLAALYLVRDEIRHAFYIF